LESWRGAAATPAGKPWRLRAHRLLADFDPVNGGLGKAPKFPRSWNWIFCFTIIAFPGRPRFWHQLGFTLEKMARGGIYDQLGGGFHRYSVDAAWVVPI